jgi:endonuclease/exonuclease/phosphatase (EEP) superfamily protein YafD
MFGGIYADILYKSDTVRIYNVHLASMNLELYQYRQVSRNYLSKIRRLIGRLKYGAETRSYQLNRIIEHTNQCPYPFIISGDFNETPYNYVYFKMRALFSNTFEEVGNGFGFTFNSMLFFLRIDHQFHSKAFEATEFRVDRSMKLSDHFPLRGFYRLRN